MTKKPLILISLCFFACILNFLLLSPLYAAEEEHRKFIYYIYWSGIRAGKAELEYISTPDEIIIQTHATSASLISLFYKVDDRAKSTLYPDGNPKEFVLKIREGRHRRHKITEFEKSPEDKPQEVVFHNILDEEVITFNLAKRAYDPLSAFYAMSRRDIKVGQSEFIDIFDNKKLFHTEIQVLKRERIKVLAGEFDTVLVKPLLNSEGIFRKTGDIYLWVTDDERKIPVLLTSKAFIGKFSVILVEGDI